MTRGQIIASALSRTGQVGKNIDPFLLNEWANASARVLRRAAGSLYLPVSVDIVAGVARYCAPPLHDIREGLITAPTGYVKHLTLLDATTAGTDYPTVYTKTSAGVPTIAVFEGMNAVVLWPTPNFSLADGLMLFGYGTDMDAVWVKASAECPLPIDAHETVVLGLEWRILQFVKDPTWRDVRQQYNYEAALLDAEASTLTPAHTVRYLTLAAPGPITPIGVGPNGEQPFNY